MTRYLIRRLIQAIPVLLFISVVVYLFIAISPIDPMSLYGDWLNMEPEDVALLEYRLGVNKPILLNLQGSTATISASTVPIYNKPGPSGGTDAIQTGVFLQGEKAHITGSENNSYGDWIKVLQIETRTYGWIKKEGVSITVNPFDSRYFKWLFQILTGDLGTSNVEHRPAMEMILERLPNTLYLMSIALLGQLLIGIPVGVLSALKQYSWFDHVFTIISYAGRSIPVFWFGMILIIVFHTTLSWPSWAGSLAGKPLFPGGGMYDIRLRNELGYTPWWDYLHHLILPVFMLSLWGAASYMRYMRSSMLDVINQDYIRTARAKGLRERTVQTRHALRNATIPLVTVVAMSIPMLFGGALFTETIFSWPGMGKLFYHAATRGDYAVIMGIVMLNALLIVLFNLIADIAYAVLDPRIKYT